MPSSRRSALRQRRRELTHLQSRRSLQHRFSHCPFRAELTRRHSVALAELLSEVILRIESASPRDLRDTQIAAFEQLRRLLEPFLFEEMTEESPGYAMKSAGNVLARIAELARHCFDSDLFIFAKAA